MTKFLPPKPKCFYNLIAFQNAQIDMNREVIDKSAFDAWYADEIAPLFENAEIIEGVQTKNYEIAWGYDRDYYSYPKTHRALLINITPIMQESADLIVQDLANYKFDHEVGARFRGFVDRAKAFLAKKEMK